MLRNTLAIVAQARAVRAPLLRTSSLQMRFKSDSGDAADSEDTKSAQSKLDQLASYLENQPQESTKTVSRPQRVNQRKQSASGPRKQEQVGPTKSFQNGQYYDPYTLNPSNMTFQPRRRALPLLGPPKREAIQKDPIHILGLNPAKPSLADDTYKNGPLLSEFVTEMGKIQPRNITGLTRKSQRYVGKAIRRARALGILPVMSRGRGSKGGDWR